MFQTNHLWKAVMPLAVLTATPASAQIFFGAATSLPTGTRPNWTASADFDGDGDQDLAITSDTPDQVFLRFNAGGGTFPTTGTFPTGAGTGPHAVVAGDFDGNGTQDLAVTLQNTDQVLLLSGNGSGGFTSNGTVSTGAEPRNMEAGDLDGDGDLDLICVNRSGNSVTRLVNGGSFAFTATTVAVGSDPRDVALADLDADGDLDYAVTSHDDREVELYRNDGGGTFAFVTNLSTPADRPGYVAAGDLDGDGDADVATSAGNFIYRFDNLGGFSFSGFTLLSTGGTSPGSLAIADLKLDGELDLVVVNEDSNNLATLENLGGGVFGAPGVHAVGTNPQHVLAHDLDGNFSPDLVTANQDSNDASELINQTAGSISRNGQDCNPVGYAEVSPAVIGGTWVTTVDIATPGASLSVLAAVDSGPLGAKIAIGEILINVGTSFIGGLRIATGTHSIAIPNDMTLLGNVLYTQAATFSPGDVRLQNAIDISFGF